MIKRKAQHPGRGFVTRYQEGQNLVPYIEIIKSFGGFRVLGRQHQV